MLWVWEDIFLLYCCVIFLTLLHIVMNENILKPHNTTAADLFFCTKKSERL